MPLCRPGWLMSLAYLDPGNLESDLQEGAYTGYRIVWVLWWATVMGLILQEMSARIGIVTGRDLAQTVRSGYPRWLNYTIYVNMEIAVIAADIQEVRWPSCQGARRVRVQIGPDGPGRPGTLDVALIRGGPAHAAARHALTRHGVTLVLPAGRRHGRCHLSAQQQDHSRVGWVPHHGGRHAHVPAHPDPRRALP
jgi:hypothetical protein